ncbi:MAG: NepR family anti-sigma factor [Bauldia sp.]
MSQQNAKPAPDFGTVGPNGGRRSTAREADWIGRKLNQVYNQTLAEPLPPHFMALIEAISDRERSSEDSSKS